MVLLATHQMAPAELRLVDKGGVPGTLVVAVVPVLLWYELCVPAAYKSHGP
jgi:hypothetical protein